MTSNLIKGLAVGLVLLAAGYFVVFHSAAILVENDPVPSDVILVLAGYREESRFWHGLELMDKGYAPRLILDIQASLGQFGVSDSELARAFVARYAPVVRSC